MAIASLVGLIVIIPMIVKAATITFSWRNEFGYNGVFETYYDVSTLGDIRIAVGYIEGSNNNALLQGYSNTGTSSGLDVRYGGNGDEIFYGVTTDLPTLKIYTAGYSTSTNLGVQNKGGKDAVLVCYDLFDSAFGTDYQINYGGNGDDIFYDQTTPNMIQRISGIFERKPLISKEI